MVVTSALPPAPSQSGTFNVSCGSSTDSAAGSIELIGGTSDKGQGRDVDIRGGQSTTAETGELILLGTYHTLVFFNIEIGILAGILSSILQVC